MRQLSLIDQWLIQIDRQLKQLPSLTPHTQQASSPRQSQAARPSPAECQPEAELSPSEQTHVAGLMRINHTGEVCAQALYNGQSITAKDPAIKAAMEHSAAEEIDHLHWCQQRLDQLGSHSSVLNPAFYALSFGIGAVAGAISDKVSLGFVAATEDQVCKHLNEHLQSLPRQDKKSKAILEQMLIDEAEHADTALAHGGYNFPTPVKKAMTLMSKVMTLSTYRI